jgi:hypothetical protein
VLWGFEKVEDNSPATFLLSKERGTFSKYHTLAGSIKTKNTTAFPKRPSCLGL